MAPSTRSSLTAASVRRRYSLLSGLHWSAVGVTIPVLIVMFTARGLSVPTIGALFVLNGVITGVLELPTGGLADSWGRRPVLLISVSLTIGSMLVLGLSATVPVLVGAVLLLATGRALSTGPLEAWYVDAELAADADADLTPGLAAGVRAEGLGLGIGTLVGGVIPLLGPGLPSAGSALVLSLSLPFLVASVVLAVELVAILVLVTPVLSDDDHPDALRTDPNIHTGFVARESRGLTEIPSTGQSLRLGLDVARSSATVQRIIVRVVLAGAALTAFEVLVPIRLTELTSSPETATAVYGPMAAATFVAAALTAGLAPRIRDRIGSPGRAALILTVAGGLVAMLMGVPVIALLGVGFVGRSFLTGPAWPMLTTLTHAEVGPESRAVMISILSLAMFTGSAIGGLVFPALAGVLGTGMALSISGLVMAVGGLALWGISPTASVAQA